MIKTKVLDGICLQRWSVWLNWMQTLQSYDTFGVLKHVVVHGCIQSSVHR